MKILFIGDIFGRPGRDTIKKILPELKAKIKPNLTIGNCENLTHGKGMTKEHIDEMVAAGIDFFTSGNHVWKNNQGVAHLDNPKFPVIRPANYPAQVPGRGYDIVHDDMMRKVLIINLLGRVFMKEDLACPFQTIDQVLRETQHERPAAIIVDMHAEATSEKVSMGHYLAGRVSAVIGTHTHVPTADQQILENHTAYITDTGMVGPKDSVIGLEKTSIIKQFITQLPIKHEVAQGPCIFNATILDIDQKTAKCKSIEHIQDVV